MEILKDFEFEEKVPLKIINMYKNRLPEKIIEIWKNYGFGNFMNGFLKIINPYNFQDIIEEAYFMGTHSIPIFVTGLGDIIIWEDNAYLTILRFRHGTFSVIESGCEYFFDDLLDEEYLEEFFKPNNYYKAIQKQGNLEYNECFGYVPLLCLGGPEVADNLEKVKVLEHIKLILAVNGPVK